MGRSKGCLPWNSGLPSEKQPRFGKKHSEESKRKLSLKRQGSSNPMFGVPPWNKGLTKETDIRVAKYTEHRGHPAPWNKGLPSISQPNFGKVPHNKGKHHTQETKHKLSIAAKRRLQTNEGKEHFKKIWLLGHIKHNTGIERRIGWLLDQLGLNKEAQKQIPSCKDQRKIQHYIFLDWFLPDYKLAIECDGTHWHNDKQKEKRRDEFIKQNGFKVLHLTEDLIRHNLRECESLILSSLGEVIVVESA